MKKLITLFVLAIVCLTGCSDDDHVYTPNLNQLTKVVCTKNGNAFFTADITYDQDGTLNRIVLEQEKVVYTENYIHVSNSISVSGTKIDESTSTAPFVHTVYTLDGNLITRKEEKQENKYMNNAVYTALTNTYAYSRSLLKSVNQSIQWPKENGTGYEKRDYNDVERYTWENGNITLCAFQKDEVSMQYGSQTCPSNFPFKIQSTLQPVGFDVVSPVNFLFGTQNKYLPNQMFCYNVGNSSGVYAQYTFRYIQTADYITGMTIQETLTATDTQDAAQNVYEYTFGYNFVSEK